MQDPHDALESNVGHRLTDRLGKAVVPDVGEFSLVDAVDNEQQVQAIAPRPLGIGREPVTDGEYLVAFDLPGVGGPGATPRPACTSERRG